MNSNFCSHKQDCQNVFFLFSNIWVMTNLNISPAPRCACSCLFGHGGNICDLESYTFGVFRCKYLAAPWLLNTPRHSPGCNAHTPLLLLYILIHCTTVHRLHLLIITCTLYHSCFNPLRLPSHCSPDLYNGIWLLTMQKWFNSAKIPKFNDNFSESS